MNKHTKIDQAVLMLESIISKNRHSLTESDLRSLKQVSDLLEEVKRTSNEDGAGINSLILQQLTEILLRFFLNTDTLDKLNDLFS